MLYTIQDEERAMRVHEKTIARRAEEAGFSKGLEEGRKIGLERGLEEGRQQGLKQGRIAAMTDSVRMLMDSLGCDEKAAVDMLQISEEDWATIQPFIPKS